MFRYRNKTPTQSDPDTRISFEEKLSKLRQDQSRQVDHQQQEMREMFALRIREKESELRAQQKMVRTSWAFVRYYCSRYITLMRAGNWVKAY